MIKSVDNDPVFKLLSPEDTVVYQIPKYQREYAWSKQHWDELFDDLLEEKRTPARATSSAPSSALRTRE